MGFAWCGRPCFHQNVAGSDQFRAVAVIFWPGLSDPSDSICVNGQGPAMHDTRAFFETRCPVPRPTTWKAVEAFHLPSGEQGGRPCTERCRRSQPQTFSRRLPTFTVRIDIIEYRMRTFPTATRAD